MKNLFLRAFSILITISIIVGFVQYSPNLKAAAWKYPTTITEGNYGYTVIDGGVRLDDASSSLSGNVIVPRTLGGYPVIEIGQMAFYGCNNITNLTIPDSVIKIRREAFVSCSSLTSVTLPDSVDELEETAFDYCKKLEAVRLPENLTVINNHTFSYCTSLKKINIPSGVRIIEKYAFFHCEALKSITIPKSVRTIDEYAFAGCAFDNIYYDGSQSSWDSIKIGAENEAITSCARFKKPYVKRLAGFNRYSTAVKISEEAWLSTNTVVLANGENYADALAGVPLAYKLFAPILLTKGGQTLETEVAVRIEKLNAKNVVILGGPSAVSDSIANSLKEKYNVERIAGFSRYQTAIAICKKLDLNPSNAIVVTGEGYADALSISPYAAIAYSPIVYSNPSSGLDKATLEYLNNVKNVTIVGGPGVVGTNVNAQLTGKNIERIAGFSRYMTSLSIAEKYASYFENDAVLATGTSFPDALAGGVFAAAQRAPMILIEKPEAIIGTRDWIRNNVSGTVYILGGPGIMPDSIVEDIFA